MHRTHAAIAALLTFAAASLLLGPAHAGQSPRLDESLWERAGQAETSRVIGGHADEDNIGWGF